MLFKDSKKIQEYAELVSEVNFASLKPTIRNIEEQMIIPVIGKSLYNNLNDDYNGAMDEESGLTDEQKSLLDRLRMVIGPYISYFYAPKGEVKLSDAGLRREETNTNKTAFQYQVKNFREACLAEAEAQTELLLQFLEDNKADYQLWANDDAFKNYRSLFIKTGSEFNEYFPSQTPSKNYWAMRPKMVDVEAQNIRTAIGEELFDDLKEKDTSDASLSDQEKTLLFKLKKATANFTVSYSVPFLNIRIDANGLSVNSSNTRSSDDDLSARSAPSPADISHLIAACKDTAKFWLNDAIIFLNKNHSDFPLFNWVDPAIPVANPLDCLKGSYGMI